jgi:predicted nuclease of predicted toxin-antitoxin system
MPRNQPPPLEWTSEEGPLLVLDENFAPRLAHGLRMRGRRAVSVQKLELKGAKDSPLLDHLSRLPEAWVLVTQDRTMPLQHADTIASLKPTIAVVVLTDDLVGAEVDWASRDIVHRWAHAMQIQAAGSIRQYTAKRSARWRWRERPRKTRTAAGGSAAPR